MRRRILWLGLAIGSAGMVLPGCETQRRFGLRPQADGATTRTAAAEDGDEPRKPAGPEGFFKPTRLRGGLSSESADIERSLGVQ